MKAGCRTLGAASSVLADEHDAVAGEGDAHRGVGDVAMVAARRLRLLQVVAAVRAGEGEAAIRREQEHRVDDPLGAPVLDMARVPEIPEPGYGVQREQHPEPGG